MSKRGYRPQRTCLGCGARDEQARMMRITAPEANRLNIARHGQGRGGYLHAAEACWQAFLKRKSVYRAFHIEVSKAAKEELVRALRELNNKVGQESVDENPSTGEKKRAEYKS